MTLQELNSLAPEKLIETIKEQKRETLFDDGIKQYNVEEHAVKKLPKRPTSVAVEGKVKDDGTPVTETKWVEVTKIALPIQKFIITQRASFAVGNRITFRPDVQESKVFEAAWETWRRSKMQYILKEYAIRLMSETEVALIWHSKLDEKAPGGVKLRAKIVSPALGDGLFPFFDDFEDLIAFGREYEGVDGLSYFDLYTPEALRRFQQSDDGLTEIPLQTNEAGEPVMKALPYGGKLPVIYSWQPYPECHDVKDLIEALEKSFSKFMDDNAYFGQPPLFLSGDDVKMLPSKDTAGKVLRGSTGADGKFLTGGNTAGSREMEFKMLISDIFTFMRAARLDLDNLKGLGDVSGTAMDRLLMSCHMAARDMQDGEFGRAIQRCMNFLLAVYSYTLSIDDKVEAEPQFSLFRIDDAADRVELAMKASGNKPVIDQEEAIRLAGLSDYPDETIKKLKEEAQANIKNAATAMQNQGGNQEEKETKPLKAS